MNLMKCLREAQFHGAKRLADSEFRLLWICSLLLFLVAALSSIVGTVSRFLDNPTHMVQLDNVKVLKFPSVNICPEIWFPDAKADKFIGEIYIPETINVTLIRNTLRELAAFYTPHLPYSVPNLELLESVLQLNGISIKKALLKLSVDCEELLLRCRLFKQIRNCSELFTKMYTNFGYCCVFNGRSLYRFRSNHHDAKDDPIKPYQPGFTRSLMVAVRQDVRLHGLFTNKWFTVQHPKQFMEASFNYTPLLPGTEHWAGYLAHRMKVGMEAVKLGDNLLGCRMTKERLRYFPLYKRQYCIAECAMDRMRKRCGCMGLTYPLPPGVRYCRARDLHCLIRTSAIDDGPDCNCQKACDQIKMEVQMQTFNLVQGTFNIDPFYDNLTLSNVSVVRAFAVHRGTRVQQRRSFYNFTNLFSELGGMFNVYLGCSILTLVEVLQMIWHSFRSWLIKRKMRRKKALKARKGQKKRVVLSSQNINYGLWRKY